MVVRKVERKCGSISIYILFLFSFFFQYIDTGKAAAFRAGGVKRRPGAMRPKSEGRLLARPSN